MKLLFDQNLSHRLCVQLSNLFPGSMHVKQAGLEKAGDELVWDYAKQNGFTIVTKDTDFDGLSVLRGQPPKVIRLGCGNQTNIYIEALLRRNHSQIIAFSNNPTVGYLEII